MSKPVSKETYDSRDRVQNSGCARPRGGLYTAELDMQTLVWAKGLRFPLGRLGNRLMCPRCGSRDVNVIFEPPPTPARIAGIPVADRG